MKHNKKKRSAGRVLKGILTAVLAVILVGMAGLTLAANHFLGQIQYVDADDQTPMTPEEILDFLANLQDEEIDPTAETITDDDLHWGEHDTSIGRSENIVNILLIGQDSSGNTRSRSDVMILLTFNKDTDTLAMTSFMRDLYVQIPNYGNSKLNHTYAWGGMALLNETLEQNFGIYVDGNIEVNFDRFTELIDLLGGATVSLRADEAAYINRQLGYGGLSAGAQHLDGRQALVYARIRKLDGAGDFGRTERQRKLLSALLEEFSDADLSTVLNLLSQGMSCLTTDMTQTQLVGCVTELFPRLSGASVISQRIPADGAYSLATAGGMSVIKADMDAARALLEQTLGTD